MSPESGKRLFCSKPFTNLEVVTYPKRGDAFLCCQAWLPVSIGNIGDADVRDLWNGPVAREIRRSVLDGTFEHCNSHCPYLQTITAPVQVRSEVTDPTLLKIIQDHSLEAPMPRVLNAAFDRSCNLSCPSCRKEHTIERAAAEEIRSLQRVIDEQVLPEAEILYITGSGDAFGSPYFLEWLRHMDVSNKPNLRIHLHTNAQLWTAPIWAKLPVEVRNIILTAEISIDAASEHTYHLNRRGGSWQKLMDNLQLISRLRASGPLEYLKLHMLVQENNFEEMPAFVALGTSVGADCIYFSHMVDWGSFSPSELASRSVHLPTHPRHRELQAVLGHPSLRDPRVDLGNLSEVLRSAERQAAVPV
jgi:hypothetical protein